eukprot:364624-Chlamydomonas_euryale.AAC.4
MKLVGPCPSEWKSLLGSTSFVEGVWKSTLGGTSSNMDGQPKRAPVDSYGSTGTASLRGPLWIPMDAPLT